MQDLRETHPSCRCDTPISSTKSPYSVGMCVCVCVSVSVCLCVCDLRVLNDGVTAALMDQKLSLYFQLLKPYSRTQTTFGHSNRKHNENQWEAPNFGLWSGVSVNAFPSRKL
jgi:hypothetical protein